MKTEYKLKIVEYWIENPDLIHDIPKELEGKVSKSDIPQIKSEIGHKAGVLNQPDIIDYAEKLRREVINNLTIESIKLNKKINLRQTKFNEFMFLAVTITALVTVTGLINKFAYIKLVEPQNWMYDISKFILFIIYVAIATLTGIILVQFGRYLWGKKTLKKKW